MSKRDREWKAGKPRPRFLAQESGPSTTPPLKKMRIQKMEVIAPSATLDGLPDNVLLIILGYLSVLSLVHVSLVCRRFRHLSSDTAIWETVELTLQSLGRKLNSQTLKKIIRLHLAPCVRSVVLEETNVRGNAVITEALLDLLFSSCPKIETITLLHCDLRKFGETCKLLHSLDLKRVTFSGCELAMNWLSAWKPSWPHLQHLSLENSAKTNDSDLLYMANQPEWQSSLRYVDLRGCYRVSHQAVQAICTSLSSLQTLDIRNCKQFSLDEKLKLIDKCHQSSIKIAS